MKKLLCVIGLVLFLSSCKNTTIEKPNNLIDENVMEDIIYDLSLLDAIKSQNPYDTKNKMINPKEYIYKKYKIDSIQFVQSNQYYVSQIETYKKMFENVTQRLDREKKEADLLLTKGNAPPVVSKPEAGQVL